MIVVCGVHSSQICVNGFVGVKTVISSSDADKRTVKAVDELQDSLSKGQMSRI
jgi:hypothetical protein